MSVDTRGSSAPTVIATHEPNDMPAAHTGAPWAPPPRFGAPVLISRDLIGGDRITVALVIALVIGLATLFTKRYRRTREATMMWALIVLPVAMLLIAWLASQITPAFVSRYFAPALAPILLLAAWGAARAGIVGLVAIILSVIFTVHVSSYTPQYKSDMRDVGGEMRSLLHPAQRAAIREPARLGVQPHLHELGVRAQAAAQLASAGDARPPAC